MANQYFLSNKFTAEPFQVALAERHHLFNVMRLKDGDQIDLVFQEGKKARAEVMDASAARLRVLEEIERKTELPLKVTILVGFPKGDKLDFIVEKATELGAVAIWAAPFDWSVVKWDATKLAKKREKLMKIAQSAAQQSLRELVPDIQLFDSLSDVKPHLADFDAVLVAYEAAAKSGEHAAFAAALAKNPHKLLMIFGPEGGISPQEIASFEAAGAVLASLGPRILRAETAPLYALSAVSALLELSK